MSIKVMSWVWEVGPSCPTERFVLLAMADIADDAGVCWPAVGTIAARCCMSERNARRIIRKLEERGWLATELHPGRNRSNTYRIQKPGEKPDTAMSARTNCPPGQTRHENRTNQAQKPDTAMSAEPSGNHQEPSSSKSARAQVRETLEREASPEAVASFMAYRSRTKAKALTVTAAKRLAASLRAIIDGGGCADDALGLAEERGWQSIKPDWYFRETRNDNRTHQHKATGTHAGDRIIAFAARAGRTPRDDCF